MGQKFIKTFFIGLLLIVSTAARSQTDPASLEAMIANHNAVRLVLDLRCIAEMGLHTLQDSTKQKVVSYESACKMVDNYNRGMSWIQMLVQGTSEVLHFGTTVSRTTTCLKDYVELMNDYRKEFLTDIDPMHIKVIKEDSILLTTSYDLYQSLKTQTSELYKSLDELVALVTASKFDVTKVKITELLQIMDKVNDNLDMIYSTAGAAYYRLYSHMMMRRGYWKHGLFAHRTMREIVDDAVGSWERAQQAAAQVIINQTPMDYSKRLGGGGLLGERRRKSNAI